jgi:hypothetical protein
MKTVKDLTELKQLALEKGAAVAIGSTRYNTDGGRVKVFPKKNPPPASSPTTEPTPTPAPAPAPAPTEIKVDLTPVASAQERLGQLMAQMMSQMPRPASPVREWSFTIERDKDGLLTGIKATAVD